MLKKLQVKQPGNEEEEDFMSRHLEVVATSGKSKELDAGRDRDHKLGSW